MTHPLLKRARAEGAPLIDGEQVTFLWRGAQPPHLIGDFNDWGREQKPLALKPLAPNLWARTLTFPRKAYIEYNFIRNARRLPDPLNLNPVPNGVGGMNHCFYMSEAAPTPLARRERGTPRGLLTKHTVSAPMFVAGGKRAVWLYQPAIAEPCPLVVVFDGPDYARRAQLTTLLDNLIAQNRIRPIALALVANGGQARYLEYSCSEATLHFLQTAVLPLARAELDVLDPDETPGAYGVLGASMGGLMALYTGLRLPHIFGRVLSQSGAFTTFGYDQVVYELVNAGEPPPIQIWMDAGKYEWLLSTNERMYEHLLRKGHDVTYQEFSAGHNYTAWRDDVWRGLEALFPPQAG